MALERQGYVWYSQGFGGRHATCDPLKRKAEPRGVSNDLLFSMPLCSVLIILGAAVLVIMPVPSTQNNDTLARPICFASMMKRVASLLELLASLPGTENLLLPSGGVQSQADGN